MSSAVLALEKLSAKLPIAVLNVEWNDPILIVGGAGWSFAIVSPWRIVADEALMLGSDSATQDFVWDLLYDQMVVSCDLQSKNAPLDLALSLENGWVLEVFSVTSLEPWTLSFADVGMFVGP